MRLRSHPGFRLLVTLLGNHAWTRLQRSSDIAGLRSTQPREGRASVLRGMPTQRLRNLLWCNSEGGNTLIRADDIQVLVLGVGGIGKHQQLSKLDDAAFWLAPPVCMCHDPATYSLGQASQSFRIRLDMLL